LFSFDGLCGKCRRIARDKPELDAQLAVQQALAGHVADLLNKGESPEAVLSMMTASGFDHQTASTVIDAASAEWQIQKAREDAEARKDAEALAEEARIAKIACPSCGKTMSAGRTSIRPSLGRTVLDVVGAFTGGGGGGGGIPDHLYFQPTEGGEQIEIPTGKKVPAHYCADCQAFVILANVPNRR
jgi:hypothetical protein